LEIPQLNASTRESQGKGPARTLRREGKVPAVLYGRGVETIQLAVDSRDFEKLIKEAGAGTQLITLTIEGDVPQTKTAMIKELQTHPLNQQILHADFYEIAMDREIEVQIPIIPVGKAIGVENGGMMQIVRREIEAYCLPLQIPEAIEVDVSELNIGDSLHIKEIKLPEGVTIEAENDYTVITVVSPAAMEEEPEEELEEIEGEEGEAEGEEGDAEAESEDD
jgi:large subunit ribosomal protein L25